MESTDLLNEEQSFIPHDMDNDEKVPGASRINAEHPNPNHPSEKDIYPQNRSCNVSRMVDESFRIDDNSNYSTTATAENKCIDTPNVPGVGLSESENDLKQNKTKK